MTRAATPSPLPYLVFASGAAALVYESLWLRSFGLVFGNTTDAIAVVLAVFMGGLAAGSAWSARWRPASPLRTYARVELLIAATAVATDVLLSLLPRAYASFEPLRALTGPADAMARAAAAALVLAPTTVLLGATVPLAVEAQVREGRDLHASLGRLYLANTLGGAVGVALAPFVLLPALGVTASFVAAAAVNLLVGAVAWRASQETPVEAGTKGPIEGKRAKEAKGGAVAKAAAEPGTSAPPLPGGTVLFGSLAAASGAFTFAIEVVWTRSLALVVGSSVYAFASMLLAVLLGIALGAVAYERVRSRIARPAHVLGLLFASCAALTLLSAAVIGRLPDALFGLVQALPVRFTAHALAGLGLSLAVLLPVTTVLGITFPLLLHLATSGAPVARTGRLYGWNTAGAVAGALLADLVLVRAFGLEGSYLLLAALVLAAGAAALLQARGGPALAGAGVALAIVAAGVVLAPRFRPWDRVRMTSGVYLYGLEWKDRPDFSLDDLGRERRLVFYEEGPEAVVAVSEREGSGRRFLSVNGKTDAGNGAEDVLTQKFIAHVPMLVHPAPRRALVVGWGAGATAAAAALYPLASLECVEIEPATYRAAPLFADLSGRVREDPRFRIVFRDGRTHLLRSRESFDVVVSEPSNPWITGVSNLFTREFYRTVLARLTPGGVFGQWFHYYRLDPEDVKTELATFADVFPHVSLWLVPPVTREGGAGLAADMLLVGSREPQAIDWARISAAFSGPPGADLAATGVVRDEAALVAAWTMDGAAVRRFAGARAQLNTDDYPWIELLAPRRNVMEPAAVAAQARALYDAMVAAATEPPLTSVEPRRAGAVRLALAKRYAETAQPLRARTALERAVADDPSLAEGFDLLGQLAIDRQDFAAAERAHRELLRLEPRRVEVWLRLSAALARQAKWAEALDALRRAQSLDPAAPVDPKLLEFLEGRAAGNR